MSPPAASYYKAAAAEQLIDAANAVLEESGTNIWLTLDSVRYDPVADPYLLLDRFRKWQDCYQSPACLQTLARTAQSTWLNRSSEKNATSRCDDTSAIHVLVVGSQSACLDSVNRGSNGEFACPMGVANTLPGPDVEQLPGSFIQVTWEALDPVFHNSERAGQAGGRGLVHLLGHYLGLGNTEWGAKCGDADLPRVVADTPAEVGPIVSDAEFD